MESIDVCIVGAGPAGTAVANALKNSELSFMIIDRSEFPRDKTCAGVLPPRIYSELKIPQDIHERPLEGYRLHSPSGNIVESVFPKPGLFVTRTKFDEYLVNELGVDVIHDQINETKDRKEYIELSGKKNTYHTKFVVGADGVNSIVRRKAGISITNVAMAAQYEILLPKAEIDKRIGNWFEVFYTIPFGYGWISPLKDRVKVGVGGISDDLKNDPRGVLDEFLTCPEVHEKVGSGEKNNFELHRIPMSGPHEQLTAHRTLLVGDAGGFVFPGTGEGIFYAIKSGRLAGKIILQAFQEHRFDEQYLKEIFSSVLLKNGLLSLRDVDFIEKVLSSSENVEKYLSKLKMFTQN
jgi:geranylgeranyl reductase family protein